jgi:glycosyltransferase involved in cell wall biosynthesis
MCFADAQPENRASQAPENPRPRSAANTAKKILMLSYEFPPLGGGGAKVVSSLTSEMQKLKQPIDLVTMRSAGTQRTESRQGLAITRVPCIRTNPSVCYWYEMIPYIVLGSPYLLWKSRREQYRINHTHFIFPDGVMAWLLFRLTGLPYVITAHGSDVPGYNPDRFARLHRLLKPLWRTITSNAAAIICPSEHLEKLLLATNPAATTIVLPNGIDVNRFRPARERRESILVVTRMFERKGVQFLLEALAGWEGHPEVNIVGDGPYLDVLKSLAKSRNVQVKFLGLVDNKSARFKELIESSRYFVFTSSAENFPVVLLEAMAAGLAIVTTNDTGCAEAVGDAALLVPPGDAAAIRGALEKLIDDKNLADSLMVKARARVEKLYDAREIAERHLQIYTEFGRGAK